jgi:predicted RNA-binding protein with PUA-like domain
MMVPRPMPFLLKTEPSVYSFADLQRDGETIWDGVTNPAAVKNLRGMEPGEKLVIYHTGDERTAVGSATVVSVDASNPKVPLVRIKVGKPSVTPHTLAEIKEHKMFAHSQLVTQGRLSVVPLSEEQYEWLTE